MTQNSTEKLTVLFCDDDSQFASQQIESLERKLKIRFSLDVDAVEIIAITNLKKLQTLKDNITELQKYDMIFCDLGWSDLTLAGVQLLHDIQMAHPKIYTILYTAQDESDVIKQALSWQFDFIDEIIQIDGSSYFEKMLSSIHKRHQKKSSNNLPSENVKQDLQKDQEHIKKRYLTIWHNIQKFPRVEPTDLLALDKSLYLNFIKSKYGGFPQMAKERALNLNNIYRVNRRFRRSALVVFQCNTIQEIIGTLNREENEATLKKLLASEKLIQETIRNES